MSVSKTTNYELNKPDGAERAYPTLFNENADIIDEQMKAIADMVAVHKSRHATGGADALTPGDIGAAKRISGTATLATASWTGTAAPYTYTLTVAGILATDTPHIDRVTGTDAAAAALINTAWGLIAGYAVKPQTSADTITFYASAKPAVAIPIMYEAVRS